MEQTKVESVQMTNKEWKRQLKKMAKLPPPVMERKAECFHVMMRKIGLQDGIAYICDECDTIFEIFAALAHNKEGYLKRALAVAEELAQLADMQQDKEKSK